eukprot:TRINITY_DN2292_c0_g1_i4.p1 TRINITY_DN2292_c0_g1~~TRINITY_DN2292_c0_g1_i4.p1  ORF type:complete len:162 (+),score=38.64 TRINITY_DN2292_c0_g1_i4:290-775(+)
MAPHNPQVKEGVVVFLRHLGCPFAEKTLLQMQNSSLDHPNLDFVGVSHADETTTSKWAKAISEKHGEIKNLKLISDERRKLWAQWGLEDHSLLEVLGPRSIANVVTLRLSEGISNRETAKGSNRYARAGAFAINADGKIKYTWQADHANDLPDIEKAIKSI